jgi:hypothetical protein
MDSGPTYHELAVELAITSTRTSWETVTSRLQTAYGDEVRWIVSALAGIA